MKADGGTKEALTNQSLMLSALQELTKKIAALDNQQPTASFRSSGKLVPRPETTCFGCGLEGHFKRNCPVAKAGNLGPTPVLGPVRENRTVNAVKPNAHRLYLEIVVDGEPTDCLLDTGSEVTLIPARLLTELPKIPVSSVIRAANGIDIEVLGEVELPVWIGNREVLVRGITSDHVAEMLLGIDWLETQGAV